MSQTGLNLVKKSEGFREFAYPDPASDLARKSSRYKPRWGYRPASEILEELPESVATLSGAPWTCGYGETKGVTQDTRWSEPEASQRLRKRYVEFEGGVREACTIAPSQNELDAMTSLAYNIGLGWSGKTKPKGAKDGFRQSSVLKAHNRGDKLAAARAFSLWNRANGKVEPGLTSRRAEEAALYLADIDTEGSMPQTVEPESAMTTSPINKASAVAGGTAALAAATEVAKTVSDFKSSVSGLGEWLVPVLLVAVVALCAYTIWQRNRQRKEGWA